MSARVPSDHPAGVAPGTPAGSATSPAIPGWRGDVAAPDPSPPVGGSGQASAPTAVSSPAVGAGQTRAAGVWEARPAARFHTLAAAMSEAELEEHVRAICNDLGVLRIHVYNSRGTTPGVPDAILIGPRGILWRELKTMRGKLTPAQEQMGHALTVAGQDWGVWRPSLLLSGVIAKELAAISRLGRAA